jgi:pantetheine-phosphate adenylyltransferase
MMPASPRIAIFPGSFDPLTYGHLDLVQRAVPLFDRIVVAILRNTAKQPLFSVEDRAAMLREAFAAHPTVDIDAFQGLLVDYARGKGARAIVRGVRSAGDLDFERQMALTNRHLDPAIETVLLLPSAEYGHVSSTLVREIVALGGSARGLVPPSIESWLERAPHQVRRV